MINRQVTDSLAALPEPSDKILLVSLGRRPSNAERGTALIICCSADSDDRDRTGDRAGIATEVGTDIGTLYRDEVAPLYKKPPDPPDAGNNYPTRVSRGRPPPHCQSR